MASMEVRSVVNMISRGGLKITVKQLIDVLKGSKQKALLDRGILTNNFILEIMHAISLTLIN